MKYAIFQMPASLRDNRIWNHDTEVRREDFLPVYKGSLTTNSRLPEDILDDLFEIFNINHPKDYTSRSMSSGDVVQLNGKDYYLCCSSGWHGLGEKF